MSSQFMPKKFGLYQHQFDVSQQDTVSYPITPPPSLGEQSSQPLLSSIRFTSSTTELPPHDQKEDIPHEEIEDMSHEEIEVEPERTKKPSKLLLVLTLAVILFGCTAYFIWQTLSKNTSTTDTILQPSPTNTGNASNSTSNNSGTIEVYITGAVHHPGIYTLNSDARVYQLLQAAGGPLPNANLVLLNLAQKLVDGQEIYVSQIGETPPILSSTTNNSNNQGQLVNINTASATDLEQKLHLSTKSAQEIINYRQQHGAFTSVDQLLQVVTQTTYNKIKNQVTV
jgi:competence protein ComEA